MQKASNNQIKLLRKLGQKKYREKEGLFVVEGERAVEQVLENGVLRVKEIFVSEKANSYQLSANSYYLIDKETLEEISDTQNPQGILAICEIPREVEIDDLAKSSGLIIATDAIQDPGNLGTIIRTATWFGAEAILSGKGTVDVFHPKVVRSTAGATGIIDFKNSDLEKDLKGLEDSGWKVLLLDGNEGSKPIEEIPKLEKVVLVVGNEANGISEQLILPKRERVLISASEKNRSVESLNAAIAVSIALYQLNS